MASMPKESAPWASRGLGPQVPGLCPKLDVSGSEARTISGVAATALTSSAATAPGSAWELDRRRRLLLNCETDIDPCPAVPGRNMDHGGIGLGTDRIPHPRAEPPPCLADLERRGAHDPVLEHGESANVAERFDGTWTRSSCHCACRVYVRNPMAFARSSGSAT